MKWIKRMLGISDCNCNCISGRNGTDGPKTPDIMVTPPIFEPIVPRTYKPPQLRIKPIKRRGRRSSRQSINV